jgi:hypothetical protein
LGEQSGMLYVKDWVEVKLKDDKGNAVADKQFKVIFPTGEIRQGTLDSLGKAKIQNTIPGKMNVKFKVR